MSSETRTRPRFGLPIGGVEVSDGDVLDVTDKYRNEPAYEVVAASADHVRQAARAARAALAEPLPAHRRYTILMAVAAELEANIDELVSTLVVEGGKPYKASRVEVLRAAETMRWSAEEAKRISGEAFQLDASPTGVGRWAVTMREPVGVVAAITPSNSPLNLVAHKVGPAIAAGNAVILKPPQATPICSLLLERYFRRAGLPGGYLNVVVGPGIGSDLLANREIDFYNFTGSTEVGEHLRRTVGLRGTLLELGGNSPVIVSDDADIDAAARACAAKGFAAAGQACTSVQRIHVHQAVHDDFLDALTAEVGKLVVGDPGDPATDVGPMISLREADRVCEWIDEAVAAGARQVVGGRREGSVVWPSVVVGVPRTSRAYCEEIFGPVVVVEPYQNLDDAIDAANSTIYGLHAAIFTRSLDTAFTAMQRLEAGGVLVNEATQWRTEFVPFGGVKSSGGSGREGPRYAIEEMTRLKVAMIAPHA